MLHYLQKRALYPALISVLPESDLDLIVTIPCHNEKKLAATLHSIAACTLPDCSVEVIVVINASERASEAVKEQNKKTWSEAQLLAKDINRKGLQFHFLLFNDLPKKHAGVGLARKIAMDEAVRRFVQAAQNPTNTAATILCCDADTLVERNYLCAVYDFFKKDPNCQAASIHYEHPTEGATANAIIDYELHLRYYVHALRKAGLPTATQTIGSSMAVRADAYCSQGGMNRRKAGEDFYFIHKFTGLGGFREITDTTVIPSPRISDRVPFGTGKAVGDMIAGKEFLSYHPQIFEDLSVFFQQKDAFFNSNKVELQALLTAFPPSVQAFLKAEKCIEKIQEIRNNTSSAAAFEKRFFQWFDAFKAMKFVHFARDGYYPSMVVGKAVRGWLGRETQLRNLEYLAFFRRLDKNKER